MGIKPKTSFRHYIPTHLPRWLAMLAPHIPHRIGKKVASRKKSRLRRKKPRLPQKKLQHRMGGMPLPPPPSPSPPPPPTQCYPLYSLYIFYSFYSFYSPPNPTIPYKKRNIPYWYCPLCTPSLTLPPSSLKCLQKSNHGIHRKCFRCFKCFGCFRCFISLLDHKTARFWSKSEQTRKIVTIQLCNNIIKI